MKTIEQAAKEYAQRMEDEDGYVGCTPCWEVAFVAGAKFAQQWISVDDELPEDNGSVLVKNKHDRKSIGFYIHHYKDWAVATYNSESADFGKITHWRPITRKISETT